MIANYFLIVLEMPASAISQGMMVVTSDISIHTSKVTVTVSHLSLDSLPERHSQQHHRIAPNRMMQFLLQIKIDYT